MIQLKNCSFCKQDKDFSEFKKREDSVDGHRHQCITCYKTKNNSIKQANCDKINYRYGSLKSSAKKRNIEISITAEQMDSILGRRICTYCDFDFSKKQGSGLNRVDSSKGYIIGNLEPCCGYCNSILNNFTKEELLDRLYKIARRIQK